MQQAMDIDGARMTFADIHRDEFAGRRSRLPIGAIAPAGQRAVFAYTAAVVEAGGDAKERASGRRALAVDVPAPAGRIAIGAHRAAVVLADIHIAHCGGG
jgi:hypothetical protein